MISEQDLQVIAKNVIDAFQRGKFKAVLPPIRAEINTLKNVGSGYSLVDGKEGEALTLNGLLPGKFIKIEKKGRDLVISLDGFPKIEPVFFQNLRGISLGQTKDDDILVMKDGVWTNLSIEEFSVIQQLRLLRSYPSEDQEKLAKIQEGAERNPTADELKAIYESNENTNAFTNQDKSVLSDVYTRSHSHKNRDLLDGYTVDNDRLQRAADSAHVHPNSQLLNKITDCGSGRIITQDERAVLSRIEKILPFLEKLSENSSQS